MTTKKSKKVAFTFDKRDLTMLDCQETVLPIEEYNILPKMGEFRMKVIGTIEMKFHHYLHESVDITKTCLIPVDRVFLCERCIRKMMWLDFAFKRDENKHGIEMPCYLCGSETTTICNPHGIHKDHWNDE